MKLCFVTLKDKLLSGAGGQCEGESLCGAGRLALRALRRHCLSLQGQYPAARALPGYWPWREIEPSILAKWVLAAFTG